LTNERVAPKIRVPRSKQYDLSKSSNARELPGPGQTEWVRTLKPKGGGGTETFRLTRTEGFWQTCRPFDESRFLDN